MSDTATSNASNSNSPSIDTAAFLSAVIVVVLLLAALWVVNHLLGSLEEVKKTAEILLPVAAIPGFNVLSNLFRKRKVAQTGETPALSQNLFSSAFIIALIIIFLFQLMSFLGGVAAGAITAQYPQADVGKNTQMVGFIIQMIGLFVNTPIVLLFCGTAGWMLAGARVSRPVRFSLYFFLSAAVLSLFDMALIVFDAGTREMFDVNGNAQIVGFVLGAVLLRPFILSLALLLGYFLRRGWLGISGYFSGNPSGAAA
jgi:hypothetical protein